MLNMISDVSDSKIRHLVGILPLATFIFISCYDFKGNFNGNDISLLEIFVIVFLIFLSASFEFLWTIFNSDKNKRKSSKWKKEYEKFVEEREKPGCKEQFYFYKKRFSEIGICLFWFLLVMSLVCFFFLVCMFFIFILSFNVEMSERLGLLLITYVFVSFYFALMFKFKHSKR